MYIHTFSSPVLTFISQLILQHCFNHDYITFSDSKPCDPGMYINFDTGMCELCPENTYQIEDISVVLCTSCPTDSYTVGDVRVGSSESDVCNGKMVLFHN